jgi:hypothetical protein
MLLLLADHLRVTAREPRLIPKTADPIEILDFCVQPRDAVNVYDRLVEIIKRHTLAGLCAGLVFLVGAVWLLKMSKRRGRKLKQTLPIIDAVASSPEFRGT